MLCPEVIVIAQDQRSAIAHPSEFELLAVLLKSSQGSELGFDWVSKIARLDSVHSNRTCLHKGLLRVIFGVLGHRFDSRSLQD